MGDAEDVCTSMLDENGIKETAQQFTKSVYINTKCRGWF